MKMMVCEMCESHDFAKQDGMFVCQGCGMKYSVEEAKKLMVEVEGEAAPIRTVKVDQSDEIRKLYELARRAKNDNNSENARKYYDMILVQDPSSWEANFYAVYYQSMSCKIAEIRSAAIRLSNCEDTILKLVQDNVTDPDERRKVVDEMGAKLIGIADMLYSAAENHYNGISLQIRSRYTQEYLNNCCAARDVLYNYGNYLIQFFGDEYGTIAAACWKVAVRQHNKLMIWFSQKDVNKNMIESYCTKIKKYDPSYQPPQVNASSGGCYVATAVYGSYDCPQVWTLRRFRDNTLAETWYGRAFIRTYYAISPTLVKWFGKTNWFKNLWKPTLDRMVNKLNKKGVQDTPYDDRQW